MKHLLIVAHMPSANTQVLAEAVLRGAQNPDVHGVTAQLSAPLETGAQQVLDADGLIIGTTENFGYMSGALKDFFDRIYYPCLEHTVGLPYGLYIRAGNDGSGARRSIERIVAGLRWRPVTETLLATGPFSDAFVEAGEELGMTLAAGLDAAIF